LFEEKLEELKTKTNAEGRDWLWGLMCDVDKWSRTHDGGWRYAFQTSNMAECFNSLLKGSRVLPVTTIVAFTFYKCVEWFASREQYARSMLEKGRGWDRINSSTKMMPRWPRLVSIAIYLTIEPGHMKLPSQGDKRGWRDSRWTEAYNGHHIENMYMSKATTIPLPLFAHGRSL
jgi:hypothetical protein